MHGQKDDALENIDQEGLNYLLAIIILNIHPCEKYFPAFLNPLAHNPASKPNISYQMP